VTSYTDIGDRSRPDYLIRRLTALEREVEKLRTAQQIQTLSTSAVQVAQNAAGAQNIAISHPNGVLVATATLTIPDNADGGEYEQALVIADAWGGVYNGSTSADAFYIKLQFREIPSFAIQQATSVPASEAATVPVGYAFLATPANGVSLLPGKTINFDCFVNSQVADWPKTTANEIYVRAFGVFVR
jgi:hypothetical protein